MEGGRDGWMGGRDGWEGGRDMMTLMKWVGACGMEWVHNREPEQSWVTSYFL